MDFGLGLILSFTDNASAGIQSASNMLTDFTGMVEQSAGAMNRLADLQALQTFSNATGRIGNSLTNMGRGVLGMFTNLTSQVMNTGSNFETFGITMNKMYGDAEEVNKEMDKLLSFSAKTPFEIDDVKDLIVVLKSQGLEAFEDMGSKTSDLHQETLAWLGDLMGFKPDIPAQRWRLAFTNFLGSGQAKVLENALDMGKIADVIGHKIGDTAQERMESLIEFIEKKDLGGMMIGSMGSWGQVMSNVDDIWTMFVKKIGDAGVFDKLKESLIGVTTAIAGLDADGSLDSIAEGLAKGLNYLLDPVSQLSQKVGELITYVGNLAKENPELLEQIVKFTSFAGVGLVVVGTVFKIMSALSGVAMMFSLTGMAGTSLFRILINGFGGIMVAAIPFIALAGVIYLAWRDNFLGIGSAFQAFIDNFGTFKNGFLQGWGEVVEEFKGYWNDLKSFVENNPFLRDLAQSAENFFSMFSSAGADQWFEWGRSLAHLVPQVLGLILAFKVGGGLLRTFTSLGQGGGLFGHLFGGLFGGGGAGGNGGGGGLSFTSPVAILKTMASVSIIVAGIAGLVTALGALFSIPHFSDFAGKGATVLADIFSNILPVLLGVAGVALVIKGMDKLGLDVKTVALGVANVAIIVGGISALVGILGGVATLAPNLFTKGAEVMNTIIGVFESMLNFRFIAMVGLISAFGFVPVKNVALGLANLSILVGGISLLTGVLGALTSIGPVADAMTQGVATMAQIMGVMESMFNINFIGTIAMMSALGFLPVTTALQGLANLAIFIGGLGVIVTAFGAIALIPGVDDFLARGGDTLANLIGQVGKIAGTVKAEFEAAQSESLPTVGTNMAQFGQNIAPFFDSVKDADTESVGRFTDAISRFILAVTANDFASLFTGDLDLANIGTQLSEFGTTVQPFFNSINNVPEQALENTKKVFEALGDIGNYNFRSGGVAQFFTGEVNIGVIGEQLAAFAPNGTTFFSAAANYNETGIERASKVFEALAGIGNYNFKTGGVAQFFTGETNLTVIGEQLAGFATNGATFFNSVANYSESGIEKAPRVLAAIAGMGNYDFKTGGVAQWFTGSTDLADMGEQLSSFASSAKPFFDTMGTISAEGINNAMAVFHSFEELSNLKTGGVFSWFTGDVHLTEMAEELTNFAIQMTWFYKYLSGGYFVTDESIARGKKMFESLSEMSGLINASNMNTGNLKQLGTDLVSFGQSYVQFSQTMASQGEVKNIKISEMIDVTGVGDITSAFGSLVTSVNNFKDTHTSMSNTVKSQWTSLVTTVRSQMTQMESIARTGATNIYNTFNNVDLTSAGTNMMRGLIEGMNSMRSQVESTAASLAAAAADAVNAALKVSSPSKVMIQTGKYVDQGLAIGMVQSQNTVANAATGTVMSAIQPMQEAGETLLDVRENGYPDVTPVASVQNVPSPQSITPLVRENVNNVSNANSGGNVSDNSRVTFGEGAIQISVANASEEEARGMAQTIMRYIDRQKELDKLMQYQNVGLPTPELAAL